MKILYLDNFRGFKESFIDLQDINFLIGENSTGKTSVLKILKSLLNHDYWMTKDLDLSFSDLGYFKEIISNTGENTSFFEIGIADLDNRCAYKLKYIEVKGYPVLSELNYIDSNINIEIINLNNSPKYRFSKDVDFGLNFYSFFKKWTHQKMLSTEKYQMFITEKKWLKNIPLLIKIGRELNELELDLEYLFSFSEVYYWFSPIRTNPKRIYDNPNSTQSPDGSHTPYLLKEYLQITANEEGRAQKKKIEFILNKFGSDSGLFESVSLKQYENSITSPFQIQVTIGGKSLNFTNVGYGVSQILPLLVEIATSRKKSIFSIQQPEVHIHPKGQAAFADFIYKSYIEEGKVFFIETHSDYLIDRFRILLNKRNRDSEEESIGGQIVFFTRENNGNKAEIIPIDNKGRFNTELPIEYRDFFIKEQFDLLDI